MNKRVISLLCLCSICLSLTGCAAGSSFERRLMKQLSSFDGKTSFYYKNLTTGEEISKDADIVLRSASLIKIPVMVEVYYQDHEGIISLDDRITVNAADMVGGAGVLCMFNDKAELAVRDLVTLMIMLSDNTAANILMEFVGRDKVTERMQSLGLTSTHLYNLLMLDPASPDLINQTSAGDMARLLEMLYKGEIIDKEASDEMLEIMKHQTVNDKLAFYVEDYAPMAHKTGDTSEVSHDVGIVFSDTPYIVCFMAEDIDRQSYNAFVREASVDVYNYANPQAKIKGS